MLVLSRKENERIVIDDNTVVTVVSIDGNRVKLGFDGPARVHREELLPLSEDHTAQQHDYEEVRDEADAELREVEAANTHNREALIAAHKRVDQLTAERDELRTLFDHQQTRVEAAVKVWQAAHNKPYTIPDLGALMEWLMRERDRLARAQPATCPVSLLWDTVKK